MSSTPGSRHRGSSNESSTTTPSSVAAAAAQTAMTVIMNDAVDADDMDVQKYDRKAKARLQKRRHRKQNQGRGGGLFWLNSFRSYGTSKSEPAPPSMGQMAGMILLFTALLVMWHYMRTVWWTHGRLAARQAREAKMTIYERAEQRVKDYHFENLVPQVPNNGPHHYKNALKHKQNGGGDDEQEQHKRQEQQERQWIHRHEQEQKHQQQQRGGDDVEGGGGGDDEETDQQLGRGGKGGDDTESINLDELETASTHRLQALFLKLRQQSHPNTFANIQAILAAWLKKLDADILHNVHGGIRWIRPYLLPPLPGLTKADDDERRREIVQMQKQQQAAQQRRKVRGPGGGRRKGGGPAMDAQEQHAFFKVDRMTQKVGRRAEATHFTWEDEWQEMIQQEASNETPEAAAAAQAKLARPAVDYTDPTKYQYPKIQSEPPRQGGYPQLTSLGNMMEHWDQDADFDGTITETLMHFNFSNPAELEMARKFRDADLPFKLIDVPELTAANKKWTDDYVAKQFDRNPKNAGYFRNFFSQKQLEEDPDLQPAPSDGVAQESPNHYFAFYTPPNWDTTSQGIPPTRNNNFSYRKWSNHAQYADAVRLSPDQPHFYWQSGVDREERHQDYEEWTFISRDLPSWSSPTANFMVFHPESQKGIQCRFGERGVVAATHYDSGRNMIGMVTGAKRYILSPPKACSNLGIFTHQRSPIFRHSLLNFGHLKYLKDDTHDDEGNGMSDEERAWLERAAQAQAVETVLKAGEVLYIPSHWFHYIISVQKSAQCNVRSGVGHEGTLEFGGEQDVKECVD